MHGLLNQSKEQFATGLGRSPVEPESELIQVVAQVFGTDRTLMCSQYPALKQAGNQMAVRQEILSNFWAVTHNLVAIAEFLDSIVPLPIISLNPAAWSYRLHDGVPQAGPRSIRHMNQPNSTNVVSILLCSNDNQGFPRRTAPTFPGLFTPNIGFIHVNLPRQKLPIRANHRTAEFMQPTPRGLVTPKTKDSLKSQGAGTTFLTRHMPHCTKPHHQRQSAILKDCARSYRYLTPAIRANKQVSFHRPCLSAPALGTHKTIRPAQCKEIRPAGLFTRKPLLQLSFSPRIVFHARKHYRLYEVESSGYPQSVIVAAGEK